MMMPNPNEEQPTNYQANQNYAYNMGFQSATALQIRLDTSSVVRQIEIYLKGIREEVYQDDHGNINTRFKYIGKPLINNQGLQWLMNFIESLFNVQVVQGNFEEYDQYAAYLERTRKDLAEHLMINLNNYEIKEENYGGIISSIMRFIEAFMSRLISNKERESYANTMKMIESTSTRPFKKGFSMPFSNK